MLKLVTAVAIVLASFQCIADDIDLTKCIFPSDVPSLPNGLVATHNDMSSASASVKTYATAMQEGLACIDEISLQLGEAATDEQKIAINTAYNEKYDGMMLIVEAFNSEIRAFRAK